LKWAIVGRASVWAISVFSPKIFTQRTLISALSKKHHFPPKAAQMGRISLPHFNASQPQVFLSFFNPSPSSPPCRHHTAVAAKMWQHPQQTFMTFGRIC
jgi:hypothetical protein